MGKERGVGLSGRLGLRLLLKAGKLSDVYGIVDCEDTAVGSMKVGKTGITSNSHIIKKSIK